MRDKSKEQRTSAETVVKDLTTSGTEVSDKTVTRVIRSVAGLITAWIQQEKATEKERSFFETKPSCIDAKTTLQNMK